MAQKKLKRKKKYRLKKNVRKNLKRFLLLLTCAVILVAVYRSTGMALPYFSGVTDATHIDGIPVCTDYVPEDYRGRTCVKRQIRWIVIHETGNRKRGADAEMHNRFLHSAEQKQDPLSWHYTVDDHQIYHHIPDDERAYHAGDSGVVGGGNDCGIGIEICVNADGNYNKAVDNTAHLVANLLNTYGMDISCVKQHADFIRKNCPEHLREGDHYERFLEKIQKYM